MWRSIPSRAHVAPNEKQCCAYLSPPGTWSANPTAVHFTYMGAATLCPSSRYPYGGTGYADPDAVTQIGNGLSTTTFTYDNNGNVTQKTVDGTTTTYVYDYANRLLRS
jgi:YD repeat-containing protein